MFHHTFYAASKAAVSAMVLNLAPELGERGITINAIAPGCTATDMAKENAKLYTHPALRDASTEALLKGKTSRQRLAQPEEIAAAVAFKVGKTETGKLFEQKVQITDDQDVTLEVRRVVIQLHQRSKKASICNVSIVNLVVV